ncbi:GGDEF domain-containing protein [Ketobacter sp.]|uniref:GGDEF domain-containing protein n=1 Tax=Ketobacter sp. TaxID=2083498 RepID=UPI000F267A56|nr:GGDEF domain-containing protein [Ketobacter sp.]RLT96327.1 MAG: GGDEF domain-containing protein [Ketobacter sp.]
MNVLMSLETLPRLLKLLLGMLLIGVVGGVDYLTGYELSFSFFYVVPIALLTWVGGRTLGMLASLVSAVVWYVADTTLGHPYSHPLIAVWNGGIRFSFFVIITWLLVRVKQALEREQELARSDNLTGAVNARFFYQLAQMEIDRLQRYQHPFTLVYFDLDNFKQVNDRYGHVVGDQALRAVAVCARQSLRKIDVLARLGGDEFALLLPETDHQSAGTMLAKLQTNLLLEMQRHQWPITFSIGALTCSVAPDSLEDIVKRSDELMYEVKRQGKNGLKFAEYTG